MTQKTITYLTCDRCGKEITGRSIISRINSVAQYILILCSVVTAILATKNPGYMDAKLAFVAIIGLLVVIALKAVVTNDD